MFYVSCEARYENHKLSRKQSFLIKVTIIYLLCRRCFTLIWCDVCNPHSINYNRKETANYFSTGKYITHDNVFLQTYNTMISNKHVTQSFQTMFPHNVFSQTCNTIFPNNVSLQCFLTMIFSQTCNTKFPYNVSSQCFSQTCNTISFSGQFPHSAKLNWFLEPLPSPLSRLYPCQRRSQSVGG